jgi:DNA-binding HxlR family transcriptional regulator
VRRKCAHAGHAQEEWRALADILARVGDKWTVMVVGVFLRDRCAMAKSSIWIDGISQRMLTQTLKGLDVMGSSREPYIRELTMRWPNGAIG